MKSMPENFVHLIITSLSYNVGKSYKNHNDCMPYKEYLGSDKDVRKQVCY